MHFEPAVRLCTTLELVQTYKRELVVALCGMVESLVWRLQRKEASFQWWMSAI